MASLNNHTGRCWECGSPDEDLDENGQCFECADILVPDLGFERICYECGNDLGPYDGLCLDCLEAREADGDDDDELDEFDEPDEP